MTLLDNTAACHQHLRNPTPWQVARAYRTDDARTQKAKGAKQGAASPARLADMSDQIPPRRRSINWAVAALVAFALPFAMGTILKLRADQALPATATASAQP